jgi:hypothetical protein
MVGKDVADCSDINRLLAAAVVSKSFCALLLSDPVRAIEQGYAGEQFSLSEEEFALILSAQCDSLQEFARRICEMISPAVTVQASYSTSVDTKVPAL